MDVTLLEVNLASVRDRIVDAAHKAARRPETVRLVAVTKRCPVEWARALLSLGVSDLGENYPQELWSKAAAIPDQEVNWHLIGHLQTNKVRRTLPLTRLVHSVDSLPLLQTIDQLSADIPGPPPVCLQVNASGEESKHGWSPDSLLSQSNLIASCRHVPIVGLMTMAAFGTDAESARPTFALLRNLRDQLRARTGLALEELSMGMSGDFEAAILEGSTIVRIGSALFQGIVD